MVLLLSRLNSFRVNRLKRLDLPTPLSPIRTTIFKKILFDDSYTILTANGEEEKTMGKKKEKGMKIMYLTRKQ